MTRRLAAVLAVAGILVGACSQAVLPSGERPAKPCVVVYSVARCQALTDTVAAEIDKNRDDVVSVSIIPDAPPGGVHLGAGWHIRVRLGLTDGRTFDELVCGGPVHEPACTDDPRLEVLELFGADDPSVVTPGASAMPIEVASLAIPIDHEGRYELPLGKDSDPAASRASGSLAFADPWPDDLALRGATVTLDLRTTRDHPRPSLVFEVLWFRPGATLEVRDLVVR